MVINKLINFYRQREKIFWDNFRNLAFSVLYYVLLVLISRNLTASIFPIDDLFSVVILVSILITIIVIFSVGIKRFVSKQKLRNQPSWVYYLSQAMMGGTAFFTIFALIKNFFDTTYSIFYFLLLGIIYYFYQHISPLEVADFVQFAPDSVGKNDDKFYFKKSAENYTKGINSIRDYISVIAIYGGMGFGKSSFTRMIIESFDKNKTLYTYISLTETNEAKDFSKLFAERWTETLSARYPQIVVFNYLPIIKTILRENGSGLISNILDCLGIIDFGLQKTSSKIQDKSIKEMKFVSDGIASSFGHIPELEEDRWVIVIDEIERAQLGEIYRVIEVIERFKIEGRTGLPLKITFMLCISREDLDGLTTTFKDKDVQAYQIRTFFDNIGKSITQVIFTPPISRWDMEKYTLSKLKSIVVTEKILSSKEFSNIRGNIMRNSSLNQFKKSDAEIINDAIETIIGLTPRTVNRVIDSYLFALNSFLNKTGIVEKKYIGFGDMLLFEYIKISHPVLIEFFKSTIDDLVVAEERDNISTWLRKEDIKNKKLNLIGWIEDVVNRKLNEKEKNEIPALISMIANSYNDFLQYSDYSTGSNKIFYEKRLSYPENLRDYLSSVAGKTETTFKKNNDIYRKHQNSPIVLDNLKPADLANYSRFLSNLGTIEPALHLDILKRFTIILTKKEVQIDAGNYGDTLYDEIVSRAVFSAMSVIEAQPIEENKPTEFTVTAFKQLKEILKSPDVNSGAKFIMLNSFANTSRGSGSSIHLRLNDSFKKLEKYFKEELHQTIRYVFDEFYKTYLEKKKIIYEQEENYFYAMYQSWSGDITKKEEIENLRKIAQNGLAKNFTALKTYWDRYPYKSTYKGINTYGKLITAIRNEDHFFERDSNSNNLYMPLDLLTKITKTSKIKDKEVKEKLAFWEKFVTDPEFISVNQLSNRQETLKYALIQSGILES